MSDFILESLAGGLDDHTPITQLDKDACTLAENVEFHITSLGERRKGCNALALPVGITGDALLEAVVWMGWFQPSKDATADELWALKLDTNDTGSFYRLTSSGWSTVTSADTLTLTGTYPYQVQGISLHGKFYLAYKSNVDRLHVWDGTSLRRVGLAAPAVPTVANSTTGGAYAATLRYYRTRAIESVGGVIRRRSEPSASVSFTPDGAHDAAVITTGAQPGEGETHWEVEGSEDDATFYRIATVAIATTTYSDSALVTSYSDNPQSSDIGVYGLIPSVQFLSTDQDRLLTAGDFTTTADESSIRWTPVGTDPDPGPDERFNDATDPRVDLDGFDGGSISGLSRMISGAMLAFKGSHVYKILRTGQLVGAYEAILITTSLGAHPRSLVDASDQAGRPALYFLDPEVGPMRSGAQGIQFVGGGIFNLWSRVNKSATVPCHGIYYKAKKQVHWWLAIDDDDFPTTKIVLQTDEVRSATDEKGSRGWSTVPAPSRIASARCSVLFHTDIDNGSLSLVPFIGKATWFATDVDGNPFGAAITDVIQRCDVGSTDANTSNDYGSAYFATVKSRPFLLSNILNQHGVMAGAVFALAGGSVQVNIVADLGKQRKEFPVDLTPESTEDYVIGHLDEFSLAEMFAIQIEFTDDETTSVKTQWQLYQFAMKVRDEQTA